MKSKPFSLKTTNSIVGLMILSIMLFLLLYTFKTGLATTTLGSDSAEEFSASITDDRDQFEDELVTQGG